MLKEVMRFLEQLTMCMGDYKNMQFNVELICEGQDYTVAVNWHLGIFSNLSFDYCLVMLIK